MGDLAHIPVELQSGSFAHIPSLSRLIGYGVDVTIEDLHEVAAVGATKSAPDRRTAVLNALATARLRWIRISLLLKWALQGGHAACTVADTTERYYNTFSFLRNLIIDHARCIVQPPYAPAAVAAVPGMRALRQVALGSPPPLALQPALTGAVFPKVAAALKLQHAVAPGLDDAAEQQALSKAVSVALCSPDHWLSRAVRQGKATEATHAAVAAVVQQAVLALQPALETHLGTGARLRAEAGAAVLELPQLAVLHLLPRAGKVAGTSQMWWSVQALHHSTLRGVASRQLHLALDQQLQLAWSAATQGSSGPLEAELELAGEALSAWERHGGAAMAQVRHVLLASSAMALLQQLRLCSTRVANLLLSEARQQRELQQLASSGQDISGAQAHAKDLDTQRQALLVNEQALYHAVCALVPIPRAHLALQTAPGLGWLALHCSGYAAQQQSRVSQISQSQHTHAMALQGSIGAKLWGGAPDEAAAVTALNQPDFACTVCPWGCTLFARRPSQVDSQQPLQCLEHVSGRIITPRSQADAATLPGLSWTAATVQQEAWQAAASACTAVVCSVLQASGMAVTATSDGMGCWLAVEHATLPANTFAVLLRPWAGTGTQALQLAIHPAAAAHLARDAGIREQVAYFADVASAMATHPLLTSMSASMHATSSRAADSAAAILHELSMLVQQVPTTKADSSEQVKALHKALLAGDDATPVQAYAAARGAAAALWTPGIQSSSADIQAWAARAFADRTATAAHVNFAVKKIVASVLPESEGPAGEQLRAALLQCELAKPGQLPSVGQAQAWYQAVSTTTIAMARAAALSQVAAVCCHVLSQQQALAELAASLSLRRKVASAQPFDSQLLPWRAAHPSQLAVRHVFPREALPWAEHHVEVVAPDSRELGTCSAVWRVLRPVRRFDQQAERDACTWLVVPSGQHPPSATTSTAAKGVLHGARIQRTPGYVQRAVRDAHLLAVPQAASRLDPAAKWPWTCATPALEGVPGRLRNAVPVFVGSKTRKCVRGIAAPAARAGLEALSSAQAAEQAIAERAAAWSAAVPLLAEGCVAALRLCDQAQVRPEWPVAVVVPVPAKLAWDCGAGAAQAWSSAMLQAVAIAAMQSAQAQGSASARELHVLWLPDAVIAEPQASAVNAHTLLKAVQPLAAHSSSTLSEVAATQQRVHVLATAAGHKSMGERVMQACKENRHALQAAQQLELASLASRREQELAMWTKRRHEAEARFTALYGTSSAGRGRNMSRFVAEQVGPRPPEPVPASLAAPAGWRVVSNASGVVLFTPSGVEVQGGPGAMEPHLARFACPHQPPAPQRPELAPWHERSVSAQASTDSVARAVSAMLPHAASCAEAMLLR